MKIKREELAKMIDHTLLKPEATPAEMEGLCAEARQFGFASVCVNPCHVRLCRRLLEGSGVRVCTVIGFPLGANSEKTKQFEAEQAIRDGAEEVDMVINIGALKSGREEAVLRDIQAVVMAAAGRSPLGENGAVGNGAVVKVIIETAKLADGEKRLACELAVRAGADFVKTSTGFGGGGATVEDVALMKAAVGDRAEVKASGGIRTLEDAIAMVRAGATRLGIGQAGSLAVIGALEE